MAMCVTMMDFLDCEKTCFLVACSSDLEPIGPEDTTKFLWKDMGSDVRDLI